MEHKAVNFIIQGMQRDLNVARYDQNFAYENMNIRLTAMHDNTLLAITNEKGNKRLLIKDEDDSSSLNILGKYVGHCIVSKYLVLFTATDSLSYIYRFKFNNEELVGLLLYSGTLNFSEDYPIEALGVYEAENIQKVYWVDGKNPIRYINVADNSKYKNLSLNTTIFDFVGEVPFPEVFSVRKSNSSSGEFASGIIQYAFSFFNENGRESNIVDVSPINYVTNTNRGADAETVCKCTFDIEIGHINKILEYGYDYIRIYSIHRTSLDSTPVTKIVTDIKLNYGLSSQTIKYTDIGTVGSIIDPYELLYKGGESLVPKTIALKDNTLFLGNYYSESNKLDEDTKNAFKNVSVVFNSKSSKLLNNNNEDYYAYKFQLDNNSYEISTFKQGETYRFGIQLQDSTGKWSEVLYIGDYTTPYSISNNDEIINLPKPCINLNEVDKSKINPKYVRLRGVIVYPNNIDKTILAQGILCPTIFNMSNRILGSVTAQSSWFARPFASDDIDLEISTSNNSTASKGSALEFRHEYIVPIDNNKYNMEIGVSPATSIDIAPIHPWGKAASRYKDENSLYYVDQSILTFHSPEFSFSDDYSNIDSLDLKMRIVGFVPLTSFISDISISTDSVGFSESLIRDYLKIGVKGKSEYGHRGLVSGLFFRDAAYDEDNMKGQGLYNYLVFPWHRNGSINDSPKTSSDKIRTAVLKKKTMSNLKFSFNTKYLSKEHHWEAYKEGSSTLTGISSVHYFNSEDLSVIRIPKPKNANYGSITYMGNIDTIVTGYNNIYVGVGESEESILKSKLTLYKNPNIKDATGETTTSKDPVSIKYKSTPHAVFALNFTNSGVQRILPTLNNLNRTSRTQTPVWITSPQSYRLYEVSHDTSKNYTKLYSITGKLDISELYDMDDPDRVLVYDPSDNKFYACKGIYNNEVEWAERTYSSQEYFKYVENSSTIYYSWDIDWNSTDTALHIDNINIDTNYGGFYLAELYKDVVNRFGGNTELDIENNLWYPAGKSVSINSDTVEYTEGDTFYQRYDCLKTYPYTNEDQNSVVEIVSFMCETHINIDGRYDRNRGQNNNLNMRPSNFNLFNTVYNQRNNFFNYRILPDSFNTTYFPTTITWTLNKSLGEKIDSWTKINLTSILELDGNKGDIRKLEVFNNEIYSLQDKAIAKILFNSRVQIPVTDGVPIEIANSGKVDGKVYITQEIGTLNKWSVLTTPNGMYFIDNNNFGIYLLGDGIKCISDMLNMSSIVKEYSSMKSWTPNEASNFRCFYDRIHSDIYFVNKYICLCYNELLGQFTSYYSYEDTPMMLNMDNRFLSYKDNYFWEFFKGDYNSFYDEIKPFYITWIANPEPMRDKVFNNLDFRSDTYSDTTLINRTFDTLEVWNEYQRGKSKLANIIGRPSSLKRKFRIWRAQIPRHNNSLQRIRNPWCYIKLSMDNPSNYKTIFYDATLTYSV